MIYITNKDVIKPFYSKVKNRFTSSSQNHQIDHDLFYKPETLELFLEYQKEASQASNPSLEIRVITENNIPSAVKSSYPYPIYIIFSSTMGEQPDELISNYINKGEIFKSYYLDSWYSESVEVINDQVDKLLTDYIGKYRSRRFSPGFKDVDITINNKLVKELSISNIAVKKSGILVPRKSTICVVGCDSNIIIERCDDLYENLRNLFQA